MSKLLKEKSIAFYKNQKFDNAEYKTKLLNIEQMELIEKKEFEFNYHNEYNLSKINLNYSNNDSKAQLDYNKSMLFKFNNDLLDINLPHCANQKN